jgi:hypothetical protein
VKIADDACGGRFDLLGYEGLSFGDPIDWSLDPVSGRRAPRDHWSRLDPLDPQAVGDSKVVWELNRHQWMVQLGQAYRLTGELRYARTFNDCIARWIDANPVGVGINWVSSLEVSFRLIAWCWALLLLRGSPVLSPALFDRIVRSIWAHAAHVEQYLSYYFSPNTHLTGEALGLVYAGLVFPELPCADRWRALGTRILVDQSARHILDDGVFPGGRLRIFQRDFAVLALRDPESRTAEQMRRFRRRSPRASSGWSTFSWRSAAPAARCCRSAMPTADPARSRGALRTTAAACSRRRPRSSAAPTARGGRPRRARGALAPGAGGLDAFAPGRAASRPVVAALREGGYAIMRSGWAPDDHHMIFDVRRSVVPSGSRVEPPTDTTPGSASRRVNRSR